jgi:hypothetical protein
MIMPNRPSSFIPSMTDFGIACSSSILAGSTFASMNFRTLSRIIAVLSRSSRLNSGNGKMSSSAITPWKRDFMKLCSFMRISRVG